MERDNPSTRSVSIESTDYMAERRFEEPQQPPSPNTLKVAATECLNSWIAYLQMLNSLCSAGVRLAQSLNTLSQQQNVNIATQCLSSWEELSKSTVIASHTIKTHIAGAMHDMSIGETFTEDDAIRQQEHNQHIIAENILTFINLHYQFSIAGCECFASLAICPSCHSPAAGTHDSDCNIASLQQCFSKLYAQEPRSQTSSPHFPGDRSQLESPKGNDIPRQHSPLNLEGRVPSPYESLRGPSPVQGYMETVRIIETMRGPLPNPGQLHTMKMPFLGRNPRSPLHFPLFPLSSQRRWSEAAAGDVGTESGDGTMRRWSMPWDSARVESSPWQQRYLPSKLAVPNTASDRSRSTTPEAVPQSLTLPSGEGLAEAIQLLSCRPMRSAASHGNTTGHTFSASPWGESHEERMHRRMFPSQRGNWQSIDVPQTSGMSVTEHYDIFPTGMPLTSRKSSSSTDSSSCLSIHSRSTSSSERGSDGAGPPPESMRIHTNMYSMWSGNEHLPFIRLPESQEPQEDSEGEENGASKSTSNPP